MILQACPGVTLLATTREALGVGGEQRYRVPSLAVPPPELARTLTAPNALEFDAVVLFAERALAADRRFVLNDENAATVANICRRLDGIALAIELAAARVYALSAAAIAASLDERFRVLTGGARWSLAAPENAPRPDRLELRFTFGTGTSIVSAAGRVCR